MMARRVRSRESMPADSAAKGRRPTPEGTETRHAHRFATLGREKGLVGEDLVRLHCRPLLGPARAGVRWGSWSFNWQYRV